MKKEFKYVDIPDYEKISKEEMSRLIKAARYSCPDAIVCMRQTAGTDFPPFMTIESPKYHEECNLKGDFELISVLPF